MPFPNWAQKNCTIQCITERRIQHKTDSYCKFRKTKKKISSQGAKKESIQGNIWHSVWLKKKKHYYGLLADTNPNKIFESFGRSSMLNPCSWHIWQGSVIASQCHEANNWTLLKQHFRWLVEVSVTDLRLFVLFKMRLRFIFVRIHEFNNKIIPNWFAQIIGSPKY